MLFSNREYGDVISLITLVIQIIQCAPRCLVLDIKIWLNWIEAQELFNQNFHLPQSTYLGHISIKKAVISEWVSVNWATLDFKTIGTQLFSWSMKCEGIYSAAPTPVLLCPFSSSEFLIIHTHTHSSFLVWYYMHVDYKKVEITSALLKFCRSVNPLFGSTTKQCGSLMLVS